MPAVNPVILLVNEPVPVLSEVFVLRSTVGSGLVLQHTPRAVTALPPSEITVPPLVAAVDEVAAEVAL